MKRDIYVDPLKIPGSLTEAWGELRRIMIEVNNYRCAKCRKKSKELHIHHRNKCPLDNNLRNLQLLCPACHKLVHQKLTNIKAKEYINSTQSLEWLRISPTLYRNPAFILTTIKKEIPV